MEREKEIQLNQYTFKLKKFTPQKACRWYFKLFGKLLKQAQFAGDTPQTDKLAEEIEKFMDMDEAEFDIFQADCLSFVLIKMESGWQQFYSRTNGYAVQDLTNPDIFDLILNSFMFTVSDFFDQTRTGIVTDAPGAASTLQNINMQMNSSSNPSSTDFGNNINFGTAPTT